MGSQGLRMRDVPGSLPVSRVPEDVDLTKIIDFIDLALPKLEIAHLTEDALWRDWLSLTGAVRTFIGRAKIVQLWTQQLSGHQVKEIKTSGPAHVFRAGPDTQWVDVPYTFHGLLNGLSARGSGTASVVLDGNSWQIWMMTSILECFDGYGNPDHISRAMNTHNDASITEDEPQLQNGTAEKNGDGQTSVKCDVIIIGGGQAGLSLAGRLHALGISYCLLERNSRIGDSWRNRYDTVKLHTPKEMNVLPFDETWPAEAPMYLPGKMVGDGHLKWVQKYGINVHTSVEVQHCAWLADQKLWEVQTRSAKQDVVYHSKHVALTVGQGYHTPRLPNWPGKESYRGQAFHSSQYKDCNEWRGKEAVVVGCGASAHDIAEDLVKGGVSVTMLQRNPTPVFALSWIEAALTAIFNSHIPTDISDRITAIPNKISCDLSKAGNDARRAAEPEYLTALEKVGFRVDRNKELFDLIHEECGGYYLDTGGSAMVANGDIKVKSGVDISHFTPNGLAFADGSVLPADIICVATGYENSSRTLLQSLLGEDLATKVGPFWGLDEEGELRGVMKSVGGVPLWLLGGGVNQARWYSRFIALQVQAELLGMPLQRHRI